MMPGGVAEIGELELIRRLAASLTVPADVVGIGDDCAVLPASHLFGPGSPESSLLLTVDCLVDGRHFDRRFSAAFDIGWKAMAVNVSDIASMGGAPKAALVTLQAPGELTVDDVLEVYRGMQAAADRYDFALVGGDTVESATFALSVTLCGVAGARPIRRSGAHPGDTLWVSGCIGLAGAGLRLLQRGDAERASAAMLERHRRPEPRLDLGMAIGRGHLATAMIDVSDGLLRDAAHLAAASTADLVIGLESVPIPADGLDVLDAITSGDDYELLFTASPEAEQLVLSAAAAAGIDVRAIGRVRAVAEAGLGAGVYVSRGEELLPAATLVGGRGLGFGHWGAR